MQEVYPFSSPDTSTPYHAAATPSIQTTDHKTHAYDFYIFYSFLPQKKNRKEMEKYEKGIKSRA